MSLCRRSVFGLLTLACVAAPPLLSAQQRVGSIRGVVTSGSSNAPVPGAQVFVVGTRLGAVTGSDGRYTISGVSAGPQAVRVRTIGFQPAEKNVTVSDGTPVTLDFVVVSAPISLDEVVVTGTEPNERRPRSTSTASSVSSHAI
jgi:hypothetical protein